MRFNMGKMKANIPQEKNNPQLKYLTRRENLEVFRVEKVWVIRGMKEAHLKQQVLPLQDVYLQLYNLLWALMIIQI